MTDVCGSSQLLGKDLAELSPKEINALDVARFREVCVNTASGCQTYNNIIRTVNTIREMLRSGEAHLYRE